jgi:hypothetical protein
MLPLMVVLLFEFCAAEASINRLPNPNTAISAKTKDILLMILAPWKLK